ncbi:M23 family metallopeptidase [Leucobacter sp. UT-8R-CII-1-4]|uniref:M23 family metallopeptidase n=1 Tax=Leucobacter sp. UT-8R-CII-1-4 TaxID=3040075 RepID=UPI0024A83F68|nr:M23 family metallopeptidase [Leucobacter sp. UT-8R-CII-1-4]MDI6022916.1 M23 family metallopeptidase [Leucobacter sp. UT-8R-CII-1-4]
MNLITLISALALIPFGSAHLPTSHTPPNLWLPPTSAPLTVSSFYDLPHGKYQAGHRGIDLPSNPGTLVRAPTAGIVSFVGTVVDRPTISIRVASNTVLSIEPVQSELKEGETISKGQSLGTVAEGGHCSLSCTHLGVRVNDEYVNPLRFFRGKAELIAW